MRISGIIQNGRKKRVYSGKYPFSGLLFFEGLSGSLVTFDESCVRRLFTRITLYDDKVIFAFKNGKEVMIKE